MRHGAPAPVVWYPNGSTHVALSRPALLARIPYWAVPSHCGGGLRALSHSPSTACRPALPHMLSRAMHHQPLSPFLRTPRNRTRCARPTTLCTPSLATSPRRRIGVRHQRWRPLRRPRQPFSLARQSPIDHRPGHPTRPVPLPQGTAAVSLPRAPAPGPLEGGSCGRPAPPRTWHVAARRRTAMCPVCAHAVVQRAIAHTRC